MLHTLQQLVGHAFVQRLTLWLNHLLASESAAMQRLQPHAGRCIRLQVEGWPTLLPAFPELGFLITPAGLLEWCGDDSEPPPADLKLSVDASQPGRLLSEGLAGQRPAVSVVGDAALAADVSWLMDNLRWDLQDDLARFIGDAPAHALAQATRKVATAVREAVAAVGRLAAKAPGAGQEPSAR
jgi:ubiquinone biosynthesis protein UbiJ